MAFDPRNFDVLLDLGGVDDDDCHEVDVIGLFSIFVSTPGVSEYLLYCGLAIDYPSEFASVTFLPYFC
jgi:hypothetical protein